MIVTLATGKLKTGLEAKLKTFTDTRFLSELGGIPGIKSVGVGYSPETREVITIVQWESNEAAESGRKSQEFQAIFQEALEYLEPGSYTRKVYEMLGNR